jgi:hypothetical protein
LERTVPSREELAEEIERAEALASRLDAAEQQTRDSLLA